MTLRVVYRSAAKIEFENAAAWYDEQRIGLGAEFIDEVERTVSKAAASPLSHPQVRADVHRALTRRFPYTIYYRVGDDALIVLAVFHGRRNPLIWQRRN